MLVVDDGPTLTHGEMPFGAGLVAARNAGATRIVDPRPFAVGSLEGLFTKWPQLTNVLPAMGYADEQLHELEATINAAECDVVVTGTPMNLGRLIEIKRPVRHATYALEDHGEPRSRRFSSPSSGRTRSIRCSRLEPVDAGHVSNESAGSSRPLQLKRSSARSHCSR